MTKNKSISIILVAPQMGENIGAIARVMSNFAFDDLRIVQPRDGWPNPKANEMAANGEYIINNAKIFDSVSEAIDDLQYVIATTAQERYMKKEVLFPKQLELPNGKIGILFGCERSGLTNEQLLMADVLVSIPTSDINSSLNIAMATGIICYEIFSTNRFAPIKEQEPMATKGEAEYFFNLLETALEQKNFFKDPNITPHMKRNIRDSFLKKGMTSQEVKTFIGMLKSLTQN